MSSEGVSLSTHVLDTARGTPATGVQVVLEQLHSDGTSTVIGSGITDSDGRIASLHNALPVHSGLMGATFFRLRFDTAAYHGTHGERSFYPEVAITIAIDSADARHHYHVPLLLSPFGYTTYRGS